jgi:hypothetical protein
MNISVFSQTEFERQKIKSSYNLEHIEQLKKELNDAYLKREERVSSYLKKHNLKSKKINLKGKRHTIYDVVDGQPVYRITDNINSARSTKTDKLQPNGSLGLNLEGLNMSIGVWDEESARGTHVEFLDYQDVPQSRVVYPEFGEAGFLGTTSNHGTHVAGTLIGKGANPDAKGMAPKAVLRSFDWTADDTEALTEASNGLLVSNHSYGISIGIASSVGAYTNNARTWDEVTFATPYYLPVKSAGNDGTTTYTGGLAPGYDKLTGNKTAKNILVVANANPFVLPNGTLVNFQINTSSSQGPTDDFRVKPDIAGDGTNVFSSIASSDSAYDTYSGTSMASPNVAGTLILLQEYYNQLNANFMKSATIRGLVCHTAIDDIARPGPDAFYGWGLLNAEASANTIKDDSEGTATIKELSLTNGETYTYEFTAAAGSPLKATICWTDPAGIASNSPGNILSPRLINDLDMRLEDSNSNIFTPWKLDNTDVTKNAIKGDNFVDNIERIDINAPVAGTYTLTVTHKGALTNGSQPFSLIITGANLTLSSTSKTISNIKVWPNPASSKLNIDVKNLAVNSKIELYNVFGSKVFNDTISNPNTSIYSINTSNLANGFYILQINNGISTYNQKIIIK